MRVNIIGCAPGCTDAPFNKGERWGINDNHMDIEGIDVIIDIHDLKRVIKGKSTQKMRRTPEGCKAHVKAVKKKGTTMYSVKAFKNIPNTIKYPIDEIVRKWGSDYFGGGPDYAIALALYKGFDDIHIYGITLVMNDEYFMQKPSFEHWIGVALGCGAKVTVHDRANTTTILRTHGGMMYGYNTPQKVMSHNEDNKNGTNNR